MCVFSFLSLPFLTLHSGHCKTLAPKWEELGGKLKGEDSVVIAKLDATANDFPPEFGVTGYPTLYWKAAGATKPEKYSGAREVDVSCSM